MMRQGSCETATSVGKKPSRSDSMQSSHHSATVASRPRMKSAKLRLPPLSPNHAATIEERSSDITPYRSTVMKPSPMLSRIICTAFVRFCLFFLCLLLLLLLWCVLLFVVLVLCLLLVVCLALFLFVVLFLLL